MKINTFFNVNTLVALTMVMTSPRLNGRSSAELPRKLYILTTSVPGDQASCKQNVQDLKCNI